MKNKLLLTGALLLITCVAIAQSTTSWGLKMGINSSFYHPQSETSDPLTGLNAGVFLNHSINSNFGLMVEGNYSQMGSYVQHKSNLERIHYLQFPVAAVWYFGKRGDAIRPKVFAGPYLGLLLASTDNNGAKLSNGAQVFNTADIGGQIGGGLNFRIKRETWLNADVRYIHGFGDITKNPTTSYQNRGINLNVGVSFPIR